MRRKVTSLVPNLVFFRSSIYSAYKGRALDVPMIHYDTIEWLSGGKHMSGILLQRNTFPVAKVGKNIRLFERYFVSKSYNLKL